MDNKALYGIDPDALYPWSPRAAYLDKNQKAREDAQAEMETVGFMDRPEDERKAVVRASLLPEDLELADSSPVVFLAPLTQKMAMRVQAARQKTARIYAQAARRVSDRLAKLTADQLDAGEGIDIREDETDKAVEAAGAVFSEEFEVEVLEATLRGWSNLKRPGPDGLVEIKYPEDKERRVACLPSAWRSAIVHAIVTETAWSAEAVEGFGLRQG